ncbi:MAG: trypsin-like peptidase domain-containing protein [Candidatus Zambryskibacteria bacterium]|nr:trypsin-like peptidase domain-containing protein [Candidatus Zambryskibacteria bacterium]
MEDLSKHQLILIVLLITFVTSIATSIISFTLLQEAPVEVTQNINRVVERTIEKVVPEETNGNIEKVIETVVINEEDRILEAIEKNKKSIVRLKAIAIDGSEIFAGFGLVISDDGVIIADARSLNISKNFNIVFYDDKIYSSGKIISDKENGLIFIKAAVPKVESGKYVFSRAVFGNSDVLKIGQSLIAITGRDSNAASIGRVFQLKYDDDKTTVTSIYSDIKISRSYPGSPAINLSGEIIGLESPVAASDTEYSYMPINFIKTKINENLTKLAE